MRLRDEYDSRLVVEMQRIRDETDREISKMKDQVEKSYLNRVSDAEASVRRVSTQITGIKEERDSLKAKNDELAADIKTYLTKISSLEAKVKGNTHLTPLTSIFLKSNFPYFIDCFQYT